MTSEIKELLYDIQNWMIDNDYECGNEGSELYIRIEKLLSNNPEQHD